MELIISDYYPHIRAIPMDVDEDTQNQLWLEAAKESFDEAIKYCNWNTAADIIIDVAHKGFHKESQKLTNDMLLAKQQDVIDHE